MWIARTAGLYTYRGHHGRCWRWDPGFSAQTWTQYAVKLRYTCHGPLHCAVDPLGCRTGQQSFRRPPLGRVVMQVSTTTALSVDDNTPSLSAASGAR